MLPHIAPRAKRPATSPATSTARAPAAAACRPACLLTRTPPPAPSPLVVFQGARKTAGPRGQGKDAPLPNQTQQQQQQASARAAHSAPPRRARRAAPAPRTVMTVDTTAPARAFVRVSGSPEEPTRSRHAQWARVAALLRGSLSPLHTPRHATPRHAAPSARARGGRPSPPLWPRPTAPLAGGRAAFPSAAGPQGVGPDSDAQRRVLTGAPEGGVRRSSSGAQSCD